jgi:hypothetical protein
MTHIVPATKIDVLRANFAPCQFVGRLPVCYRQVQIFVLGNICEMLGIGISCRRASSQRGFRGSFRVLRTFLAFISFFIGGIFHPTSVLGMPLGEAISAFNFPPNSIWPLNSFRTTAKKAPSFAAMHPESRGELSVSHVTSCLEVCLVTDDSEVRFAELNSHVWPVFDYSDLRRVDFRRHCRIFERIWPSVISSNVPVTYRSKCRSWQKLFWIVSLPSCLVVLKVSMTDHWSVFYITILSFSLNLAHISLVSMVFYNMDSLWMRK